MFRTAFSTVACPHWTLDRAIRAAADFGYEGLELRTFGHGSTTLACDPALTAPAKLREMLAEAGVDPAVLATSVTLDAPISPPILGRIFGDPDRPVRVAKAGIDLAASFGCPFVRIFGFEIPRGEKRASALNRIAERLALAVDAARNTGVRLVLENGGSFPTARLMLELLDRVDDPLLGAEYSMPVAVAAGEDPAEGIDLLTGRLWVAKIKDRLPGEPQRRGGGGGRPCLPGDGEMPCGSFVRTLHERGYRGWLVFEWDWMWVPDLDPPEVVLPELEKRLYDWLSPPDERRRADGEAPVAEAQRTS